MPNGLRPCRARGKRSCPRPDAPGFFLAQILMRSLGPGRRRGARPPDPREYFGQEKGRRLAGSAQRLAHRMAEDPAPLVRRARGVPAVVAVKGKGCRGGGEQPVPAPHRHEFRLHRRQQRRRQPLPPGLGIDIEQGDLAGIRRLPRPVDRAHRLDPPAPRDIEPSARRGDHRRNALGGLVGEPSGDPRRVIVVVGRAEPGDRGHQNRGDPCGILGAGRADHSG
ncbi:hypothetical protein SDC9_38067 [bioreactor metagenome]|uniref:Uncharacterized protein n=1 Tax=bioreactor metagenome TaxID=1076179 RepID=A0A644VKQ3_9ZZZZ